MILQSNALHVPLADKSVQCCVTSPPYWGLRDYGTAGQLGLESTPDAYVAAMVAVFREVWRVLRDDGVLWLNLGDSYSAGSRDYNSFRRDKAHVAVPECKQIDLPPKNLVGIPWRVAFALQADGWFLRQDIIWAKPNPTPESVRDRCTKAHEYIFLMTKSARYYWDAEAIKEESVTLDPRRPYGGEGAWQLDGRPEEQRGNGKLRKRTDPIGGRSHAERGQHSEGGVISEYTHRNRRSVWTINTEPFPEAHFATFPTEIPRLCILAASKSGDVVLDPFAGSGTTIMVANELGRRGVGLELNPEYCQMADRRCRQMGLAI